MKIFTLVLILFVSGGNAFAMTTPELIVKIREHYEQLDSFYVHQKYAENVFKNIEEGKEPPEPPPHFKGGKTLLTKFEEIKTQIEQIALPEEADTSSVPSAEDFFSNNKDVRRRSINNTVKWILEMNQREQALTSLSNELEKFIEKTKTVYRAARELGDGYGQLYQHTPIKPLSDLFGFAWYDIETIYLPKISAIEREAKKKKKDIDKVLAEQTTGRINAASNVKFAIQGEREALESENHKLQQKKEEIEKLAESFAQESNNIRAEAERLMKEKEQLSSIQVSLVSEQSKLKKRIDIFNKKVSSHKEERSRISSMQYNLCPNGEVFEKCTHNDKKRQFVNDKNSYIESWNNRANKISAESKQLDSAQKSFSRKARDFDKRHKKFTADADRFNADQKLFEKEQEKARNEFIELMKNGFLLSSLIEGNEADMHTLNSQIMP